MDHPVPAHRQFDRLTWPEVAALPPEALIIQPLGATEQHGHHLPLAVDRILTEAVLAAALAQLPEDAPVYVLPSLAYGKSNEHRAFPGTISLSATTLLAMLMDLGDSLAAAGCRRLLLLNGHGGQPQVCEIAATDIHDRHPELWVFPHFLWRAPHPGKDLISHTEARLGMHAGDLETSLMLAIAPELVRLDRLGAEYPPPPGRVGPKGPLSYSWRTQDLSASGVIGDATAASREKGEAILAGLASGWAEVLRELLAWSPPPVRPITPREPPPRGRR